MQVGVLALQGDWAAHAAVLRRIGAAARPVRTVTDLGEVDALVLPGGESTAMLRLMSDDGLETALAGRLAAGLPVLATCAGVILVASRVAPAQRSFAVLDVAVERNAYGRQVHSTVAPVALEPDLGAPATVDGVFIRAPRIVAVGPGVRVLGRRGPDAVLVQQGAVLAATYHPELTGDDRLHRRLVAAAEVARV